jgi:TonB-dependent SusC/RagA subfamily outer membrane receptor
MRKLQDSVEKPSGHRGRKMNTYNDIYQMIRAEVSGVVVSGKSIQIQQGHSFFGSSTPLFVINGVVVESIDNVNPLEVRSIKILKGSEAAIYGVRGSNGVVSITLKNGTEK